MKGDLRLDGTRRRNELVLKLSYRNPKLCLLCFEGFKHTSDVFIAAAMITDVVLNWAASKRRK